MAGICTSSVSPNSCGHRDVTITLDGEAVTLHMHENEAAEPLTAEEKAVLARLAIRRLRNLKGVTLAQLLNRVTNGDEATNVKAYDLLPAGSAITLTNVGTAWKDALPGANGQRSLVDCTGCTEFRIVLTANLVGTGPFGARVVRDSDGTVFYEAASIAQTGERELDTDWQPIPAWATGLEVMRLQAKSTVASDDPVFRRCTVLVR